MDFDRTESQTQGAIWAGPAALVVSLLATASEALCCMGGAPALVFVVSMVGVLFAWIALRNSRDNPENRVMGATGLVISLINVFASLGMLLFQVGLIGMIVGLSMVDP